MKKILLIILLVFIVGCSVIEENVPLLKAQNTTKAMDTYVSIIVYHQDEGYANRSIQMAFDEIHRVEKKFDAFDDDSLVSIFNTNKSLGYDSEFAYVLERSLHYSNISDGAFDITIQPLLDLYGMTFSSENRSPTDEELQNEMEKVGYEKIEFTNDNVFLTSNGSVTFGGIAKGFAIDRAVSILMDRGIDYGLVNAGGDIRAIGTKPEGVWTIALENPRDKDEFIMVLGVNHTAVATSGDYERYFDEGMKAHHIMNPKTGRSATEVISATVVADRAVDADALSTTVFVLGPEKGMELINSIDRVEGIIISADREVIKSTGLMGVI